MTLLSRNSTPAERARGCVFSELFRDAASVARNGGVPTGAPVIDKGVTLDGSTQYLTYNSVETVFNSSEISFVVEFYPDFDLDLGADVYLCDSSSVARHLIIINSAGALAIYVGGINVAGAVKAAYESYWIKDGKNVLVFSGTSGSNKIWLNGELIADENDAWTAKVPAAFYIGARYNGASSFDGRITKFQIYNRKLTAQEAADFYDNTVYDYRNQQSLHLPFGAAQHDPTNVRSLDVSGNGRHATFGDGSTPSTYPTKLGARHGYDFDGTADYLKVTSGTGVFNAAGVTIVFEFWPDFAADDGSYHYLMDSTGGALRYMLRKENDDSLRLLLGGTTIFDLAGTSYQDYWYKNKQNILTITGESGDISVWLNSIQIVTSNSTVWTFANPSELFIGVDNSGVTLEFDGQINSFQVWPKKLTPLQVADLTIRSGITVNNV